jgi:hypothetical protein
MHNAILKLDRAILNSVAINSLLGVAAFAGGVVLLVMQ